MLTGFISSGISKGKIHFLDFFNFWRMSAFFDLWPLNSYFHHHTFYLSIYLSISIIHLSLPIYLRHYNFYLSIYLSISTHLPPSLHLLSIYLSLSSISTYFPPSLKLLFIYHLCLSSLPFTAIIPSLTYLPVFTYLPPSLHLLFISL